MKTPKISLIAAIQKKDRGLGYENGLLFKIRDDLKRFKQLTSLHPIIMGRKTFESIGFPLPNRANIVITRNPDWSLEGVIVASSLQDAIAKAIEVGNEEMFVIGGGEIYNQALPIADRLYLTLVDGDKPADTFFPEYETLFTNVIEQSETFVDPETNTTYSFLTLEK